MGQTVKKGLRAIRRDRDLTQTQLGERVGISQEYVSRMEIGSMIPPSQEVLEKLAEVLGTKPELLFSKHVLAAVRERVA